MKTWLGGAFIVILLGGLACSGVDGDDDDGGVIPDLLVIDIASPDDVGVDLAEPEPDIAMADVPDGPELSTALISGCFDWPAQEFTPDNIADGRPTLTEGELAVDFTLEDVDGKPHTLSQLLATKPVLLVLGAFT